MHRHTAWALVAVFTACGPGGKGKPTGPVDRPPPVDKPPELPAIPSHIETASDPPMSDDTPGARSPILDVMAAENKRSMDVLSKANDPAYYLAYQIAEQRVVTLDAEGGALIGDGD